MTEATTAGARFRAALADETPLQVVGAITAYAARVVRRTRGWPGLVLGASPRAGIAMLALGRAAALMRGRSYVVPDDVAEVAPSCLKHRVTLSPEAEVEGRTVDQVLAELSSDHVREEEQLDELVKVIREGLGSKDGRIDKDALVAALNHAAEGRRYAMSVFAARLLHAHGDPAKAIDILRKNIEMGGHEGWAQAFSTIWRREWESQPGKAAPAQGN